MRKKIALTVTAAAMLAVTSPAAAFAQTDHDSFQRGGSGTGSGTTTQRNDAFLNQGSLQSTGSGSVQVQNTNLGQFVNQRNVAKAPADQDNNAVLNQGSSQSTDAGSVQVQDTNQNQLINQRNAAKAPADQDNNAVAAQGSSQFQSGGVFQLQNTRQNQFASQHNVIFGDGGSESTQNNFFSPAQFSEQVQFSPFAVLQAQSLFQNSDADQDNRFVPAH